MKPFRPFAFPCAAAALAALAGCQQATPPAPEASASVSAGPDARPGIAASEGRMVLPVVAGRPAAIYFSVRNDGAAVATLAAVHVAGAAQAEMHKTQGNAMSPVDSVDIAPATTIEFAPGGYHVMAFDLAESLKPGASTELTLTFSDGDKVSMPLRIEKMGGDMPAHDAAPPGMEGMHH